MCDVTSWVVLGKGTGGFPRVPNPSADYLQGRDVPRVVLRVKFRGYVVFYPVRGFSGV